MIALVKRLPGQHGEDEHRDRRGERPEALKQAGALEDRRREGETERDRQEAKGGDGEFRPQPKLARQRHRRPIEHQGRRRIDLDDVAIGRRAIQPFFIDRDQPGDVAEQAETPLQQDRGERRSPALAPAR